MGRIGLWLSLGLVLLTVGCAKPPPAALLAYGGSQGGVQFMVAPNDAQVFVDAEYKGLVRDFQGDRVLWLLRGLHAVEIRRDGYLTFFRQIQTSLGLVEIFVFTMQPDGEVRTSVDDPRRR